jgi:hypothetical protein
MQPQSEQRGEPAVGHVGVDIAGDHPGAARCVLSFEAKGLGWSYGDKPIFVLISRDLPRTRNTVEFSQAISRSS